MFFFGADKKQDSPAPQPQRIDERSNYGSPGDSIDEIGNRRACIARSFGTNNLDKVLERYAPEHSDILKEIPETQQTIRNNQKVIHEDLGFVVDKIKEQDKKLDELGKQLKAQDEAVAALQEKVRIQSKWNEQLVGKFDFISGTLGKCMKRF